MQQGPDLEQLGGDIASQVAGFLAGALLVMVIIGLISYAIAVFPKGRLFQMAGYPAWQGWIPFVNTFVQAKITGRNPWLILGLTIGLPILASFPVVGSAFWLLPALLFAWMAYDLAVVYGQTKGYALAFAIISGSAVGSSQGINWFSIATTAMLQGGGDASEHFVGDLLGLGMIPLIKLTALVMLYIIAFGSGTRYEGPYSHRSERMLMHQPWLFVPGPNQTIPIPNVGQAMENMYSRISAHQQASSYQTGQANVHQQYQQYVGQGQPVAQHGQPQAAPAPVHHGGSIQGVPGQGVSGQGSPVAAPHSGAPVVQQPAQPVAAQQPLASPFEPRVPGAEPTVPNTESAVASAEQSSPRDEQSIEGDSNEQNPEVSA